MTDNLNIIFKVSAPNPLAVEHIVRKPAYISAGEAGREIFIGADVEQVGYVITTSVAGNLPEEPHLAIKIVERLQ